MASGCTSSTRASTAAGSVTSISQSVAVTAPTLRLQPRNEVSTDEPRCSRHQHAHARQAARPKAPCAIGAATCFPRTSKPSSSTPVGRSYTSTTRSSSRPPRDSASPSPSALSSAARPPPAAPSTRARAPSAPSAGTDASRVPGYFENLLRAAGVPEDALASVVRAMEAGHAESNLWRVPLEGAVETLRGLRDTRRAHGRRLQRRRADPGEARLAGPGRAPGVRASIPSRRASRSPTPRSSAGPWAVWAWRLSAPPTLVISIPSTRSERARRGCGPILIDPTGAYDADRLPDDRGPAGAAGRPRLSRRPGARAPSGARNGDRKRQGRGRP